MTLFLETIILVHHLTSQLLLLPFYGNDYTGQPTLRTGGFHWSKVLLPACPCWRQL